MAAGTTSIQITREASQLLDEASKTARLPKSHLADMAIKLFYDAKNNPALADALEALSSGRQVAEQEFMKRLVPGREDDQ